jgi:hypothetical protein
LPRCASFEPYPEAQAIWSYLQGRFGMAPEGFRGYRLWHSPGRPTIWLAAEGFVPQEEDGLETVGLPLLRQPLPRGLPTTAFVQRFGHLARKNVIQVGSDAVIPLMQGKSLPWGEEVARAGPLVVNSGMGVLGRGWIKQDKLLLDAPKEWAKSLDDRKRDSGDGSRESAVR